MSNRTQTAIETGQIEMFAPAIEVPVVVGAIATQDLLSPNETEVPKETPKIEWHDAINDGETPLDDLEIAKRHLHTLNVLGALSPGRKLSQHKEIRVSLADFNRAHAATIGTEEFIALHGEKNRAWAVQVRQLELRKKYEKRFADNRNFERRNEEIARTKKLIKALETQK